MASPPEISAILEEWARDSRFWMLLGSALLGMSIVGSLVVAAFGDRFPTWAKVISLGAAICTTLVATFNPIHAGFVFRSAWRLLEPAVIAYETGVDPNVADLIKAYKEGEALIDKNVSEPSRPSSASSGTAQTP